MAYFLLVFVVIFTALQNVFVKQYEKKGCEGEWLFSAITVFFAATVFVISYFASGKSGFAVSKETLMYSVLFAFFYAVGMIGQVFAIKTGSLALTSLMISFSLLIPTFFGIWVLGEETSLLSYLGIGFLVVSLYLVNYQKSEADSGQKITVKWIVFVAMAALGNGGCVIVQRLQQINQNGLYKDEFMMTALLAVFAGLVVMAVIFEKNHIKNFRAGFVPGFLRGVSNGVVNNLCLVLVPMMPASVLYPVASGCGIALTALIAIVLYHEKLSSKQIWGLVFGITSVVLLSI